MTNSIIPLHTHSVPNTVPAAPVVPSVGFFESKFPAWIILASFVLVTLPVAGILIWTNSNRLLFLYFWIFSTTHFVLTFTIYMQSENLSHFTATRRNLLLFVVIPLAILAVFYGMRLLRVDPRFPVAALLFGAAVRILDFNHFNRQAFGVYQLFKARAGLGLPKVCKTVENAYFICLSGMLFITFLAGGISPWISREHVKMIGGVTFGAPLVALPLLRSAAVACAGVAAILLAASFTFLWRAWRAGGRPSGLWESLTYIAFQTLSAALAIAFLPLYGVALAIHYAEYHVLMYPRCFHRRLDLTRSLDRWYQALRGSRVLFYGLLLTVSAVVTFFTTLSAASAHKTSGGGGYLAFVAIFDGIFVCHYFIEMLIWKFSDPFFRRTAGSLYFAPRARTSRPQPG